MKNSVFFILIMVMAFFCSAIHAGQIYKWVDEHGNVHYSQSPTHQSAEEMHIKIPKSSESNKQETNTTSKTDASPEKNQAEDPESFAKKEQEAKKKNCQIAMKRLATITAGGRLYEVNEKGERSYWDDNTRKAKQAEAQKDVDQWCSE